mgnify:CR=1 FL=1
MVWKGNAVTFRTHCRRLSGSAVRKIADGPKSAVLHFPEIVLPRHARHGRMVRYGHCTVSARLDALTPRSYRARNALVGVRSTAEPKKSPSMSAAHSVTDLCVRVRQTDRQTDRRFSRRRASRHWARGCLDRCRRRRRRETLTQHIPRRRRCRRARLRRTTGCWWLDVVSAGFLVAYRPYTSTPSVCADPDGRIGS